MNLFFFFFLYCYFIMSKQVVLVTGCSQGGIGKFVSTLGNVANTFDRLLPRQKVRAGRK
jgi:hypothetical protein